MATLHTFPASAAGPLVEGYCSDFIGLAASMAQTLEQASMRKLSLEENRASLTRVERGMRELADAIASLLGTAPAAAQPAPEAAATTAAPERPAPAASAAPARAVAAAPEPDRPMEPGALTGKASFTGTTDSMPITSVFQFLSRMRKTGQLHVKIGDENLAFGFVDGCVEYTTTDRSPDGERLGDLLVQKGFAEREKVEEFARRHAATATRHLGAAILREGLVTNGQLMEVLERQVHLRFHRAFTAKSAGYEFSEGRRNQTDGRIRILPSELLFASRQRVKDES
jgi:hypothetical protein